MVQRSWFTVMRRRSPRLQSIGYYDSEGKPFIHYKETKYRHRSRSATRRQTPSSVKKGNNLNRSSNSRGSTMFNLKICGFPLFILPLCFGLAYFTLSSNILDSRPSNSLVSNILNMDSNLGYEDMVKRMRKLQDELLCLRKKVDYLLPNVDTWPNFALEMQGASVLFQRSSKTYPSQKAGLTFFGIPLWRSSVSPRTVIQGHSPLILGCCWAFEGDHGHLSIALSHPVNISHVTVGHISKNLSPNGSISSAPKEFSVYGMKTLDGEETNLGTFLYDQNGNSVQTFILPGHEKDVFNYVKLQVENNWGHDKFTCLYSFRVHGKLAD